MIRSIHFASESWAPVESVMSAHLVKDSGIAGDRQTTNITLIEAEAVDTEGFAPGESRRNITVTGVALNPLVGKRFRVGSVLCEGTELCQPCAKLEAHTQRPGLARRLVNQAGIRARVLEEGEIHVGDTITEENDG
ncbi:MOSC domain-containing protein [Armatimonas sp.]|uniref:MOSC domain-containing protein n=1 Tax=Armatimonas sp. TaxID=1872638 RepID=UPI00374D10EE